MDVGWIVDPGMSLKFRLKDKSTGEARFLDLDFLLGVGHATT